MAKPVWEYKIILLHAHDVPQCLVNAGLDGWELVSVFCKSGKDVPVAYLKREKK